MTVIVTAAAELGEDGRCCGRKPLTYKRDGRLFCTRCCRGYAILTGEQIGNYFWEPIGVTRFASRDYEESHPLYESLSEYTRHPGPTGYKAQETM